ncbi:hypothetical protein CERZMDRAFT_33294 [Cercospora zeae-maydis SCOH1-5]|uniref:Uncharacterized protein n=1 Tax=Cercospora zeae-maydis SCOH1-5 TaxID=717836 RepID=A0A6A6FSB9_9PEZI|nr:hypothetical protein CERZMDRAFT_33294 [Cercospora zeae-maydis SCOH1-5]
MAPIYALLPIILAAFTIASPATLVSRQELVTAQTIQQDVVNIHTGVESLREHVSAYNGEPLKAVPLAGDFTAIHLANRKGFANANIRQTDFTAEESTAIVQTVIDTVGISIPASVDITKEKKPLFDEAGLSPVILGALIILLDDHNTFSAAVQEDLSADFVRAEEVVVRIRDAIQDGIDFYST